MERTYVCTLDRHDGAIGFPFVQLLPSHIVAIISLIVLGFAVLARYQFDLAGSWRRIFKICSSIALYLNAFVGVVQAFQKIPALKALAPTHSEVPFLEAQLLLLIAFVVIGVRATSSFRALSGDAR